MCGIAGYTATRKLTRAEQDEAALIFTDLMVGLEDRGVDASGIFVVKADNSVSLTKGPGPAGKRVGKMLDFIETRGSDRPIVVGHTRHATHGSPFLNVNNHPFQTGRLTGVHNGVFAGYRSVAHTLRLEGECDSEAIFRLLAKCKHEDGFWKVFDQLSSYNRMVFWDKKVRRLYAYCHDRHGLAFVRDKRLGVVWFATTKRHLPTVFGAESVWAQQGALYIMTERGPNGQVKKEAA